MSTKRGLRASRPGAARIPTYQQQSSSAGAFGSYSNAAISTHQIKEIMHEFTITEK